MVDLITTVLVMSLTGGILTVLMFLLKPFARDRLSKAVQYYLWLVVIAAFLTPVSRMIVLPETNAVPIAPVQSIVEQIITPYSEPTAQDSTTYSEPVAQVSTAYPEPVDQASEVDSEHITGYSVSPVQRTETPVTLIITLAYLSGAILTLSYHLIGHVAANRILFRRNRQAGKEEYATLAGICGNRRIPKLYRNPLVSTPMMVGLLHPTILLPDREYTRAQLGGILCHEVTHLRRKDIVVKWLAMLCCAVHWFNPAIWLARREFDRACELSCDEAVIRGFDTESKFNYCETMLLFAAHDPVPKTPLSTTLLSTTLLSTMMCDEKLALKARFKSVMSHKRHTRFVTWISASAFAMAILLALSLGAGAASVASPVSDEKGFNELSSLSEGSEVTTETPEAETTSDAGAHFSPDMPARDSSAIHNIALTDRKLTLEIMGRSNGTLPGTPECLQNKKLTDTERNLHQYCHGERCYANLFDTSYKTNRFK